MNMFEILFGHFIKPEQLELINNIYNEVINYGTPYILFYQKKK